MGEEQKTSKVEDDNPKVMDFMKQWLRLNGISQATAAERSGINQNTISHWMKVDDAKLSSVENLFDWLGYKISFSLNEPVTQDTQILRIPAKHDGTQIWMKSEPMPELDKFPKTDEDRKRLHYIKVYLIQRGITYKKLAECMGRKPQTVQYWFMADDIFISRIYEMAKALGAEVYISCDRKKTLSSQRLDWRE